VLRQAHRTGRHKHISWIRLIAEPSGKVLLVEFEAMVSELQPLIDKVWRHCEDKGTRGRTVTLKVKLASFELISRSRTAIDSRNEFENVSADLLKALFPMQKAVRLLSVSISGFDFEPPATGQQIELL
jgi:DNA polymerase-4